MTPLEQMASQAKNSGVEGPVCVSLKIGEKNARKHLDAMLDEVVGEWVGPVRIVTEAGGRWMARLWRRK